MPACTIELRNSVQLYRPIPPDPKLDAYRITRSALNGFVLAKPGYSPQEMEARGELVVEKGGRRPLDVYHECLDVFDFWFPVTTP